MKGPARTFLLILLAMVLWGREAQGRGSTETWVSPCTLDVVLVTFKDTTLDPAAAHQGVLPRDRR